MGYVAFNLIGIIIGVWLTVLAMMKQGK